MSGSIEEEDPRAWLRPNPLLSKPKDSKRHTSSTAIWHNTAMSGSIEEEDPRAWLRPNPLLSKPKDSKRHTSRCQSRAPQTEAAHGLTNTMMKAGEFQNMLTAVMHPHAKTGYKDQSDACNRTDKRNGGEFRRFKSTYSKAFASVDERPIQFRRDGLPISARQVAGRPLMAPKLPSTADLTVSKRLCAKYNHKTNVCIGVPRNKDPRHFNTVYSLVHTAPHRALGQPNSGIAAEDAARGRKQLGLFS